MAQGANDVRAGGAWYELYGKDKLSAVLDGAKKKAESLGGAMKAMGGKVGPAMEGALGGIKDGLKGLGMALGQEAFKGVVSLISGLEDLKKEYEKTARMLAHVDMLSERNTARQAERIESLINPKEKELAITKEIARLERDKGSSQALKEQFTAEKNRTGMFKKEGSAYERLQGFAMWFTGEQESTLQNVQAKIDAQNAAQDKLFTQISDLSEKRGRLLNPDKDPEKIKVVAELTRELDKQTHALGKSADAIKAYEMKLDGFSVKQIKDVQDAMKSFELMKNASEVGSGLLGGVLGINPEAAAAVKDVTTELKKQADLWNATADQVALYELRLKGANEAQLAGVKAEQDRLKLLNMFGGAADAIANGAASTERATLATMGSFSGLGASQVFGGDSISLKTLKASEQTAKNTEAAAKGIDKLAMGLRFK